MLTSEEIAELAKDLESFRVERKESFTSVRSKIEEAICAFANDLPGSAKPGILLLGVADDGTPTGLPIDDALLLNVSGIRGARECDRASAASVETPTRRCRKFRLLSKEYERSLESNRADVLFAMISITLARLVNSDQLPERL